VSANPDFKPTWPVAKNRKRGDEIFKKILYNTFF
jgi:hypothetical protein